MDTRSQTTRLVPRSSDDGPTTLSLSFGSSVVLLLGLSLVLAGSAVRASWDLQAKVIRVLDGDSVEIAWQGSREVVDLEEIEAPALYEEVGEAARQRTSELALGKTVRVEVREGRTGTGTAQRLQGSVVLPDGRRLEHELVREGLARWRGWCRERGDPELGRLEDAARRARRGIWSLPGTASLGECQKPQAEAEPPPRSSRPSVTTPEVESNCLPRSRCCRVCSKGKACGNSCINRQLNCHKGRGCACNASELCG